jgi:DNA-binding NtrC family response regulator
VSRASTAFSVPLPPTDDDIQVEIRVIEGPETGTTVALDERLIIGSDEDCDLVLGDEEVSKRHAEIAREGGRFVVRDLGSKNGTNYLGSLITKGTVPLGATLRLGATYVRIQPALNALDVEPSQRRRFGEMVAESLVMREVFAILELASQSDVTVLIEGETGTGKELVARALHEASDRRQRPFVAVDCGSMPHGLLESELFGHVKGAFTGADRNRDGAFVRAHTGTLFLDELAGVDPAVQARLLRAIESRTIRPVGSDAERGVDIRVVGATTKSLEAEMEAGRFRSDLYYRLSVLRIPLPPLRKRLEDIPLLVTEFLRRRGLDFEACEGTNLARLKTHRWPGNIRELRNVVDRAVALSPTAESFSDLRLWLDAKPGDHEALSVRTDLTYSQAKEELLGNFERSYLRDVLARADGNISKAARIADVDRKHFRSLLKKHGLV